MNNRYVEPLTPDAVTISPEGLATIDALKLANATLVSSHETLVDANEDLSKENREYENEIDSFKVQVEALTAANAAQAAKIEELTAELAQIRAAINPPVPTPATP